MRKFVIIVALFTLLDAGQSLAQDHPQTYLRICTQEYNHVRGSRVLRRYLPPKRTELIRGCVQYLEASHRQQSM